MSARDVGTIVFRALAVSIAIRGFAPLVYMMSLLGDRHFVEQAATMAPMAGLLFLSALILWTQSAKLWPSDTVVAAPDMEMRNWQGLAFLLVGIFFLMRNAPQALVSLWWGGDSISWSDVVTGVMAIALVVYGGSLMRRPIETE